MAEISYICSACQKSLSVDESLIGQDVACPACAHVMTVPRIRAKLTIKGRQSASPTVKSVDSAPENLSDLADIDAFGGEREERVVRLRRWALAQQLLASLGMLATISAVVYGGYRFYDARETKKLHIAQALLKQESEIELRHAQRVEAKQLGYRARQQHTTWSLSDEECYRLWRALNLFYPSRKAAQAHFDAWVKCDAELYGLFSEVFAQVQSPAAIETACQRLAGLSLGLSGGATPLPPLDEFRRLALQKLAFQD